MPGECVSETIRRSSSTPSSPRQRKPILGKYLKSKQAGPIKGREVAAVWLHLSGGGRWGGEMRELGREGVGGCSSC